MEAPNGKRKGLQKGFDDGQQIGFADAFDGRDDFKLSDLIDGVDVINPRLYRLNRPDGPYLYGYSRVCPLDLSLRL